MTRLVEPRTLRGFRDYPPHLMMPREQLLDRARRLFRSYGFAPIDTPALELTEILLAKVEPGAEIQKQLYRFQDAGGRDVALRFDLTVPLARFAAQHAPQLGLPFKRYHIGPVWRGESPQAGRFREFLQCDFDIIGVPAGPADIEIALVIHDLLQALGLERFVIRVNTRLILNALLDQLGVAEHGPTILRALDKLAKIGPDGVGQELSRSAALAPEQAEAIIGLAQTTGPNRAILDRLAQRFPNHPGAQAGIDQLRRLGEVFTQAGIAEERLQVDLSICRGLDYYTGVVFETFLLDQPDIGSVCSGGRYDNLAGCYTKLALPGVGASLGLDRLLAALEALHLLPPTGAPAPILILHLDAQCLGDYHRMARTLRAAGLGVEVYPEARKLAQQFQYAERRGVRVALIAGGDEFAQGVWKVKDLARREERAVPEAELAGFLADHLRGDRA